MVLDVGSERHLPGDHIGDGRSERATVVGLGGTLRADSRSRWALERALEAAAGAGATTRLLALRELDLPLFQPGKPLAFYPQRVASFLAEVRHADGMLWSTGAYHGTLAGATKNALDFLEFLSADGYLDGISVGLIATSGGDMAAVNAIDAMVHTAHALRAIALPLKVPIGGASRAFGRQKKPLDDKVARRLSMLGAMVVGAARRRELAPVEAA